MTSAGGARSIRPWPRSWSCQTRCPGTVTLRNRRGRCATRRSNSSRLHARRPQADPAALKQESLEIVVQENGKLRGRVAVPVDAQEDKVREIALADEGVARHVGGKAVKKVIVVPGKLVNIVVVG